jgi:hypothetical protein
VNLPVDLVPRGVLAVVAGGGHDDHAEVGHAAHGLADGVVLVRVDGGHPEGEVDDAYVVEGAVGDDPVHRLKQLRDRAAPLRVEHLDVDDLRVVRGALVRAARDERAAGRRRGDVRAVPVGVELAGRRLGREDEVAADARRAARVVVGGLVPRVDARVEDGDADEDAVRHHRRGVERARRVGARRQRDVAERVHLAVGRDVSDVFARRQRLDRRGRHLDDAGAEVLVPLLDARAVGD